MQQHQVAALFGLFVRTIGAARFVRAVAPVAVLVAVASIPLPRAAASIDGAVPSSGIVQMLAVARHAASAPRDFTALNERRRAAAADGQARNRGGEADGRLPASRIGERWLQLRAGQRAVQAPVGPVSHNPGERSLHAASAPAFGTWSMASVFEAFALPGFAFEPLSVAGNAPRVPAQVAPESVSPLKLSDEQRSVSRFVAQRYRLDLDEVQRFVAHAFRAADEFHLDPYLVLAVMSIESSFDPNARSSAGAQGLMQVLTRVHLDKFVAFGGARAAFDPVANISVGARILKEYLVREGSVEGALKSYVGAALLSHDFGYGNKVLAARARLVAAAHDETFVQAGGRLAGTTKIAMAGQLPGL